MNYQISLKPPSRRSNAWKESLIKGTKLLGPWHYQKTKLRCRRKGTMPHVSFRWSMLKHNPRARNCSKKILRENWRAVPAGGVLLLKSHSFKQTSTFRSPMPHRTSGRLWWCSMRRKKANLDVCVFFWCHGSEKENSNGICRHMVPESNPNFWKRKRRLQMFYSYTMKYYDILCIYIYKYIYILWPGMSKKLPASFAQVASETPFLANLAFSPHHHIPLDLSTPWAWTPFRGRKNNRPTRFFRWTGRAAAKTKVTVS